jgi:hypothetical protein
MKALVLTFIVTLLPFSISCADEKSPSEQPEKKLFSRVASLAVRVTRNENYLRRMRTQHNGQNNDQDKRCWCIGCRGAIPGEDIPSAAAPNPTRTVVAPTSEPWKACNLTNGRGGKCYCLGCRG